MPKLQTFYGVWTTDDEMHGSYKAYAQTRELAEEELKNHHDFYCSTSPIPDNKHIVPMNMIVADNSNELSTTQKDVEFKTQKKPIYLAVSSKVPQKGRILILDKIINQNDPVYWWGWEQTNVGRVNGVKTIADNMFKVTTKNAIYIVQVFDR